MTEDQRKDSVFNPQITIVEEELELTTSEAKSNIIKTPTDYGSKFLVIGGVCIGVIFVALSIRCYVKYSQRQFIDQIRIKQAKEDYQVAEMHSVYESTVKKNIEDASINYPVELEPQYDANHDFAIFGCGDNTKGGIQTLAEKMNLAEQLEEAVEMENKSTNSKSRSDPSLPENQELEE